MKKIREQIWESIKEAYKSEVRRCFRCGNRVVWKSKGRMLIKCSWVACGEVEKLFKGSIIESSKLQGWEVVKLFEMMIAGVNLKGIAIGLDKSYKAIQNFVKKLRVTAKE